MVGFFEEDFTMKLGTHNSATGGKLIWWQRPIAWLLNITAKCQQRTIEEQLEDGVKLFNLQVTLYNGEWHFSHGTTIYKEKLLETLALIEMYAKPHEPIFFNLYLDDNFFLGQNCEEFRALIKDVQAMYNGREGLTFLYGWIEGSEEYFRSGVNISCEEHYWSLGWAKKNAKSWIDYLPLPKRHAIKHNDVYIANCKEEYLMLDYYDLK